MCSHGQQLLKLLVILDHLHDVFHLEMTVMPSQAVHHGFSKRPRSRQLVANPPEQRLNVLGKIMHVGVYQAWAVAKDENNLR
jgi:hypothetical protein